MPTFRVVHFDEVDVRAIDISDGVVETTLLFSTIIFSFDSHGWCHAIFSEIIVEMYYGSTNIVTPESIIDDFPDFPSLIISLRDERFIIEVVMQYFMQPIWLL